jgi:hypothetical protein
MHLTMRRVFALSLLVLVACETLTMKNRAEPIPTDKCGASVVTFEDERLYVFSLSEDSVVWHKFQKPEGGWSTWTPVADRRKMSSGPTPVRHLNGTVQVFARGADRQYYVSTMTSLNAWSDWTTISESHTFLSPPVPVITAAGTCMIFGIDSRTHSVWYSESTPITSEVFSFSNWVDLGGDATSPPSVLIDAESLAHVFIRGTNRGLWHLAEIYPRAETVLEGAVKTWGEWECIGGVMSSSPRVPVALNGANLPEVYGRAADKALWSRRLVAHHDGVGAEWDAWTSLGGVLASGPSAVLNDDGVVQVFARATDKAIYSKSQFEDENGETHFTQWHTLGGMFSTTPSVIVRADGLIDIFARGVDKAIWHSHQVESNGTRTFSSWHSLGGHTRKFTC